MNSINVLPKKEISAKGIISETFLSEGIKEFQEACSWVQGLPYGYNSNKYDPLVIFKDKYGTCSTKHGVIAALAAEISLPVYKYLGFYKLDGSIITGIEKVLSKYDLPFIPQTHCFLGYNSLFVDLTSGNCHGKNKDLVEFDLVIKTEPMPDLSEEEDIYRYGMYHYYQTFPFLRQFGVDTLGDILRECDSFHSNLCALKFD